MKIVFRWFGEKDRIPLSHIRQIPNISGVVSALYDIPAGSIWPYDQIVALKKLAESKNLELEVIESVPVHEDIKLGTGRRDEYIDNYIKTLGHLGKAGIKVVCYNFMPVFDWTRTSLAMKHPDGATSLNYEEEIVLKMDPTNSGTLELPGWVLTYKKEELSKLIGSFKSLGNEGLWKNIEYFLKAIIPAAEKSGIKMAIHPDDPPWPIFKIPRIITDKESLRRLLKIVDNPSNGLTLCSGSLGADKNNNIPDIVREFSSMKRIHFAHMRNVKITKGRDFYESSHFSGDGSLDIVAILKAYYETGFDGYIRPDHGRMIWDENGKPGYGLYDRALGIAYINGIWETLEKTIRR